MSDTPRTDAARGYFDMETAVDAEEMAKLERELKMANDYIKRLEKVIQERDKEWFQVIESILGFHPVSMTEALHIGIERIKKQKQRIKRLEEAGDAILQLCRKHAPEYWVENINKYKAWEALKEAKP